jgi:hypothetical protein
MATPLKPLQSKQQLIADLLREYPTLTRERLIEMAEFFGFDLTDEPPVEEPAKPQSLNSYLASLGWTKEDAAASGETITIIGAPRPPAKKSA